MVGALPENRIRFPMIRQDWCDVTFVHWSYPPDVVQSLLPADLVAHTFDEKAWVTLSPFRVDRLRGPVGPQIPGVARFAETNLRTYVLAADGSDGLSFFDIEASNAAVVWTTRSAFGLPYRRARMGVSAQGHPRYISTRTSSGGDVGHDVLIEVGARLGASATDLDTWLIGRWRAFGSILGRRISIEV